MGSSWNRNYNGVSSREICPWWRCPLYLVFMMQELARSHPLANYEKPHSIVIAGKRKVRSPNFFAYAKILNVSTWLRYRVLAHSKKSIKFSSLLFAIFFPNSSYLKIFYIFYSRVNYFCVGRAVHFYFADRECWR